jgi:hypothetical protein
LIQLPCRALVAGIAALRVHIEHVDDAFDERLKRVEKKMDDDK